MKRIAPIFLLIFLSCKNSQPFNKALWDTRDDMTWPYRENMLNDLIKNHRLVGLKYNEAVKLLGSSNYTEIVLLLVIT